jgi:hypothetical protein
MGIFIARLDIIQQARDGRYITGDTGEFFRSTDALFFNVLPKLKEEFSKVDAEKEPAKFNLAKLNELDDELRKLGAELTNLAFDATLNKNIADKNRQILHAKLRECNIKLNQAIHEAGIIYPKKELKTIGQLAAEDY